MSFYAYLNWLDNVDGFILAWTGVLALLIIALPCAVLGYQEGYKKGKEDK